MTETHKIMWLVSQSEADAEVEPTLLIYGAGFMRWKLYFNDFGGMYRIFLE